MEEHICLPKLSPRSVLHNAAVSYLVAGQQVVETLDDLIELLLTQHGDGLHEDVALAVAGLAVDDALHAPLRQRQLLWQLPQDALLVKLPCPAAEHAGHL